MKENNLETCGIKRLDGTYARTRSTLFLEDTWIIQAFTRRLDQMNEKIIYD